MNKDLIIRILGKEPAIKLDDEIYNLRIIVDDLRPFIILHLDIDNDTSNNVKEKLMLISITIKLLRNNLDSVSGYTNSKAFLSKFLDNIYLNINEICTALKNDSFKDLTYHTNCLDDLLLIY